MLTARERLFRVVACVAGLLAVAACATPSATAEINSYLAWGAGPRASQYLVIGAKCHAALKGKFSPDIEDVKAVAVPILRHRIVRNYRAEADGVTIEKIIANLF